jgi:hypothetical protein
MKFATVLLAAATVAPVFAAPFAEGITQTLELAAYV